MKTYINLEWHLLNPELFFVFTFYYSNTPYKNITQVFATVALSLTVHAVIRIRTQLRTIHSIVAWPASYKIEKKKLNEFLNEYVFVFADLKFFELRVTDELNVG